RRGERRKSTITYYNLIRECFLMKKIILILIPFFIINFSYGYTIFTDDVNEALLTQVENSRIEELKLVHLLSSRQLTGTRNTFAYNYPDLSFIVDLIPD